MAEQTGRSCCDSTNPINDVIQCIGRAFAKQSHASVAEESRPATLFSLVDAKHQIVIFSYHFANDLHRRLSVQNLCLNVDSFIANRCNHRFEFLLLLLAHQLAHVFMIFHRQPNGPRKLGNNVNNLQRRAVVGGDLRRFVDDLVSVATRMFLNRSMVNRLSVSLSESLEKKACGQFLCQF